jgi:ABC-type sugar transport system ATPase subunit
LSLNEIIDGVERRAAETIKAEQGDYIVDGLLHCGKCNTPKQYVSTLSGGNKQKVVLARWIGKDSDIVVLDSPTRGIDILIRRGSGLFITDWVFGDTYE